MNSNEISNLIFFLKNFFKVGNKQSEKMAYQILKSNSEKFNEFLFLLNEVKNNIKNCEVCQNYTIDNICEICLSKNRSKKLMIVENIEDISKYEDWGFFDGKYYVFPIIFNNNLEKRADVDMEKLLKYLVNFDEVVLALSATIEGALTANFIDEKLSKKIKVSHLANGIPIGASIEYVDKLTFEKAFENRKESN